MTRQDYAEQSVIFQNARALIEREGWGQWSYSNCTLGRIGQAAAGHYCQELVDNFSVAAGLSHVYYWLKKSQGAIMRWNDEPCRTKEEVLAALDDAIGYCVARSLDPVEVPLGETDARNTSHSSPQQIQSNPHRRLRPALRFQA